jgi:hypothetical protein
VVNCGQCCPTYVLKNGYDDGWWPRPRKSKRQLHERKRILAILHSGSCRSTRSVGKDYATEIMTVCVGFLTYFVALSPCGRVHGTLGMDGDKRWTQCCVVLGVSLDQVDALVDLRSRYDGVFYLILSYDKINLTLHIFRHCSPSDTLGAIGPRPTVYSNPEIPHNSAHRSLLPRQLLYALRAYPLRHQLDLSCVCHTSKAAILSQSQAFWHQQILEDDRAFGQKLYLSIPTPLCQS